MTSSLVLALCGVVTALLALWFFYFPWQTLVIDQTRQRLFEARDKWFDYSLNLPEEADRAAAAGIRSELNGLIRLTHHISVPVLLYAAVLRAVLGKEVMGSSSLEKSVLGFRTQAAAKEAQMTVFSCFSFLAWSIIRRSLTALILFLPLALILLLFSATTNGVSRGMRFFARLIEETEASQSSKGLSWR